MADGINRCTLLGNLGAEPELKFVAGNRAMLKMRIATTESYVDADNVRKENVQWHDAVLWGPRGEAVAKFLRKGSRVLIEGRIEHRSYEGSDGVKRYATDINVTNIVPLDGRKDDAQEGRGDERRDAPSGRAQPPSQPRASTPLARVGGPPPVRPAAAPSGGRSAPVPSDFGPPDDDQIPF